MQRRLRTVLIVAAVALIHTQTGCEYDREKPIFMAPGSYGDLAVVVSSNELVGAVQAFEAGFNQRFTFVLVEEPLFKLSIYPPDRWDRCKNYKNILFLWRVGDGGPVEKYLRGRLTAEGRARAASGSGATLRLDEPFASYQHAVIVSGTDRNSLMSYLRSSADQLRDIFVQNSAERIMRRYRYTGLNTGVMNDLWVRHRFSMDIPNEFKLNQNQPDGYPGVEFMQTGPSRGLTIAWRRSDDPHAMLQQRDWLLEWRREIGARMHDDEVMEESLVWKEDALAGMTAVKLEGAWASRRFDGGGPFWSWFVHDPHGDRLFCLDALCYAPGVDKMDFFRRMQAILQTFTLQISEP